MQGILWLKNICRTTKAWENPKWKWGPRIKTDLNNNFIRSSFFFSSVSIWTCWCCYISFHVYFLFYVSVLSTLRIVSLHRFVCVFFLSIPYTCRLTSFCTCITAYIPLFTCLNNGHFCELIQKFEHRSRTSFSICCCIVERHVQFKFIWLHIHFIYVRMCMSVSVYTVCWCEWGAKIYDFQDHWNNAKGNLISHSCRWIPFVPSKNDGNYFEKKLYWIMRPLVDEMILLHFFPWWCDNLLR